jgi:hypothetical protein
MTDDLLDPSRRDALEIRLNDRIHQSFLHPSIASEELRLERELPEPRFSEDGLTVPGLEGSVLVAVPLRLPRIGPFIRGGSHLPEGLLEHHLVEEPGG